jgi:xanthine/CO dehydrogenase XdhC/CoxF family maturation factor
LKQTDQPPISTRPLANGAGHTFFKRLDCPGGLGMMARASRELAISHLAQHAAQRLLGDSDTELLENPLAEIDDPPAHDPMN